MPQSGIKATEEVKRAYDRVFKKNKANKLPYAVFKFGNNDKEIVVDSDEKFYKKHLSYNDLLGSFPSDQPRFVVYDLSYINKDNVKTTAVILVSCCPKDTPVRLKFLVGSSIKALAQSLNVPQNLYIEGEGSPDCHEEAVCSKKDWKVVPDDQRDPLSDQPLNIHDDKDCH